MLAVRPKICQRVQKMLLLKSLIIIIKTYKIVRIVDKNMYLKCAKMVDTNKKYGEIVRKHKNIINKQLNWLEF